MNDRRGDARTRRADRMAERDGAAEQIDHFRIESEQIRRAEARLYETLFTKENPNELDDGQEFTDLLNPNSLEVVQGCKLEPSLASATPGISYQFERLGYFCVDKDSTRQKLTFNRTVALRDTWAKIEKKTS